MLFFSVSDFFFLFLQKYINDLHMTALWLENVCLLHDLLVQHSPKQVLCMYF